MTSEHYMRAELIERLGAVLETITDRYQRHIDEPACHRDIMDIAGALDGMVNEDEDGDLFITMPYHLDKEFQVKKSRGRNG